MYLRSFVLTLVAGMMASAVSFAQTTNTITRETITAPFGLGSTETARVSVVNVANNLSNGTAASCTGSISFLNSSGTAIGSASSFTVTSGQITGASLTFVQAGGTGVRTEIRAEISQTLSQGVPCALQYVLETYDSSSGATHIYLSNSTPAQSLGFGH